MSHSWITVSMCCIWDPSVALQQSYYCTAMKPHQMCHWAHAHACLMALSWPPLAPLIPVSSRTWCWARGNPLSPLLVVHKESSDRWPHRRKCSTRHLLIRVAFVAVGNLHRMHCPTWKTLREPEFCQKALSKCFPWLKHLKLKCRASWAASVLL